MEAAVMEGGRELGVHGADPTGSFREGAWLKHGGGRLGRARISHLVRRLRE